ncbi:uracil-DNA glycosylase family protein [Flavobacterium sp. ASW18X]|uniref:uracil-DNA glycosylase family protein n=1 Tax=Flavobacterium sp. ASW18X TaxID=2572595 RepID=UPI0010AEC209|nr:uracil-DNA glycosylase family protein [Flavobacterium sp. ASW18X]TKD65898.1 uracil-DNA glycosylase family protein [Flavobacterium sp. ASW18X]
MLNPLLEQIRMCTLCQEKLPLGPRPIISAQPNSKLLIIGQALGSVVHKTGIPWDDKSGENLRHWMGISANDFYNEEITALVPMGFCYPGKGISGDLPPHPECAETWHSRVLQQLPSVSLTLLIGNYAQNYYLRATKKSTLTKTVKAHNEYLPSYFVLPHPSPRNAIWQAKNPWFKTEVLPRLKEEVAKALAEIN